MRYIIFASFFLTCFVHAAPGAAMTDFNYVAEQFADIRILRYQSADFNSQPLERKKLLYCLAQAAISGRDIIWDQHYEHNLLIRRSLEEIVKHYPGDRDSDSFKQFMIYVKRVWFSNGIHHHYSNDKFIPYFSPEYFDLLVKESPSAYFPTLPNESKEELAARLKPILFDPLIAPKKVSLDTSTDLVKGSSVNFYHGVTQAEAKTFYQAFDDPSDKNPPSYGLNSRLVMQDGIVKEQVYKVGGLYGTALERVVYWLKQATSYAESAKQAESLTKLAEYYETGDLRAFDAYNIVWVDDTAPVADTINGFIEVYSDPLGLKGSWEAVVSIKDSELTKKYGVLSEQAAWFEQNSPILPQHKRQDVKGVSYKVVQVVMEAGDSSPATPIGINLPNSNWIRAEHGSKSVSLGNIEEAYDKSSESSGALEEFFVGKDQQELIRKHGSLAAKLTTGLHEVIGHASGQIMPGVGKPADTLGSYASTLEEARADLVALYYIGDEKLMQLGLVESTDVMKAEYLSYLTNGLLKQLARIELGKTLEESHMRNRQMISQWILHEGAKSKAVELKTVESTQGLKSYVRIYNHAKLRELFGVLLREVQRIKSEGDGEAGKNLVEKYGVQIDRRLHEQVRQRWAKLNLAPYSGFINPELVPHFNEAGEIIEVRIEYPEDFTRQMLHYAQEYSFLPTNNSSW